MLQTLSPRALLASALTLSSVLLSGCGMNVAGPASSTLPNLQGKAFGGQNPINGAVIQLWAVGLPTSGGSYGAGQASKIGATVTTGPDGTFTITGDYTCVAGDYYYITATGGSAGSLGSNSAINLMAAIGDCTLLLPSSFINISEATTVAGVWSLQKFATATWGTAGSFSVGAPSTNVLGLQNAFGAVNNLVSTSSGQIATATSASATLNGTAMTLVTTSENTKVATLANILAACVNSADVYTTAVPPVYVSPSSNCTSLFNSVKPSGQSAAPADTLQAALDMALNPTTVGSSSTPPFSLSSSSPPFVPNLGSSVPNDFTLALTYASTQTLGTAPTQNLFMYHAYAVAVDGNGNVFVLSGPAGSSSAAQSSPFYNSVAEISPFGKPLGSFVDTSMFSPRGMAIDKNNNVWTGNSAAVSGVDAITKIVPSSGAITTFNYSTSLYGVAVNGNNDVFATSGNAGTQLTELVGGTGTITGVGTTNSGTLTLAIDANNGVWVSSNGGGIEDYFKATCTTLPCTYPSTNVNYTGFTGSYGIAIDSSNAPWVALNTSAQVEKGVVATPSAGGTKSTANLGGLNLPEFLAFDGSGNLWITNTTISSSSSVTELAAGSLTVALSPSAGFVHNYTQSARGIAIDASGNVWVGNQNGTNASSSPALTEIVGAASPVVTPLAAAIAQNKLGQLP